MFFSEANRVIIRIWLSSKDQLQPQPEHISFETADLYISLWSGKIQKFQDQDSNTKFSYADDLQFSNDTKPAFTICFYKLNPDMMENEFHKIIKQINGWHLMGSNLLVQTARSSTIYANTNQGTSETVNRIYVEDCTTLALKILKSGEIGQLVNLNDEPKSDVVLKKYNTLDELVSLVTEAKQAELKTHPATKNYAFAGETNINELETKFKKDKPTHKSIKDLNSLLNEDKDKLDQSSCRML